MEAAVLNDPALAIGTAKELVETCCKTILEARSISFSRGADLPELTHGKAAGVKGLGPRHAKLAVGAASTLAVFLTETHNDRPPR
jgi:hypothetical protein